MPQKIYNLKFHGYLRGGNSIETGLSGIYGIYAYRKTGNRFRLMYIGESNDVKTRIEEHKEHAGWQNKLQGGEVLYFNVAPVRSGRDRKQAEAAMIYKHKPKYNTEYKRRFPFETTTINISGKSAHMCEHFTVYCTE